MNIFVICYIKMFICHIDFFIPLISRFIPFIKNFVCIIEVPGIANAKFLSMGDVRDSKVISLYMPSILRKPPWLKAIDQSSFEI